MIHSWMLSVWYVLEHCSLGMSSCWILVLILLPTLVRLVTMLPLGRRYLLKGVHSTAWHNCIFIKLGKFIKFIKFSPGLYRVWERIRTVAHYRYFGLGREGEIVDRLWVMSFICLFRWSIKVSSQKGKGKKWRWNWSLKWMDT